MHVNQDEPFIFTSGWASPVYVDCRKLISYRRQRRETIQLASEEIDRRIGRDQIAIVAQGETAGIPLTVWIADYFLLPIASTRSSPKWCAIFSTL